MAALPALHPPTADTFRELYAEKFRQNKQILSIHISSKMSDTVAHARQAADEFLGGNKIVVIDSLTTSIGLGWLVEAAAEAAANGAALDEIVRIVRGMITHMYAVFFVDQLDYLERNGRLSKSQAVLGTMLGIKPFLTIEDGEIIPMEKVRTRDKAIDKLLEFVSEFSAIDRVAHHAERPAAHRRYAPAAGTPGTDFPRPIFPGAELRAGPGLPDRTEQPGHLHLRRFRQRRLSNAYCVMRNVCTLDYAVLHYARAT